MSRKEKIMSKKKKKIMIDALIQEMAMQGILNNMESSNNLMKNGNEDLDYIQQVQENGKRYEQECRFRTSREMAALAYIVKGDQQELHEIQKVFEEFQHITDRLDGYVHDIRKEQKKQSKRIDKQQEKLNWQQTELEKHRKQIKEQAKTICLLATCLGLGSVSDNLSKIRKICSKEIDQQRANRCLTTNENHSVIEGTYREM